MSHIFNGTKLNKLESGIFEAEDIINSREITVDGIRLYRFLDRLWLPAPTSELSQDQIAQINRFRERRYDIDPQFEFHRAYTRKVAGFVSKMAYSSILEIGCGVFPICNKMSRTLRYQCVESDLECVAKNITLGVQTHTIDETESQIGRIEYDCFVSLFVFQFPVEQRLFDLIAALVPQGDGVFNVATTSESLREHRINQICDLGFACTSLPFDTDKPGYYDLIYATRKVRDDIPDVWRGVQG